MPLVTIEQISLDIHNNSFVSINAKQYDTNSRFVEITCTEDGKQMILDRTKIEASVRYKKPDGNNIFNDVEILENGKVKLELTQQMLAVSGRCQAELMLTYARDESVLSTMYFYVNVLPISINNNRIESSYEYNALLKATVNAQKVAKTAATLDENGKIPVNQINTTFGTQKREIIKSGDSLDVILGKIAAYMQAFDNLNK